MPTTHRSSRGDGGGRWARACKHRWPVCNGGLFVEILFCVHAQVCMHTETALKLTSAGASCFLVIRTYQCVYYGNLRLV
jgi:hypothetical protein